MRVPSLEYWVSYRNSGKRAWWILFSLYKKRTASLQSHSFAVCTSLKGIRKFATVSRWQENRVKPRKRDEPSRSMTFKALFGTWGMEVENKRRKVKEKLEEKMSLLQVYICVKIHFTRVELIKKKVAKSFPVKNFSSLSLGTKGKTYQKQKKQREFCLPFPLHPKFQTEPKRIQFEHLVFSLLSILYRRILKEFNSFFKKIWSPK